MPIIQNTAVGPNQSVRPHVVVEVRLLSGGKTVYAPSGSLVGDIEVRADRNGFWSVDLWANVKLSPTGTRWEVTEWYGGSDTKSVILVPDGVGPYLLRDILDAAPGALADAALSLHMRDAVKHAGAATFIHDQPVPSASWVISHNLGRFPSVTIVNTANEQVIPQEIRYDSNMQVTVLHGAPFGGKAFVN